MVITNRAVYGLKEIVYVQHGVLNWDSHLVARVENPLLVHRLP